MSIQTSINNFMFENGMNLQTQNIFIKYLSDKRHTDKEIAEALGIKLSVVKRRLKIINNENKGK